MSQVASRVAVPEPAWDKSARAPKAARRRLAVRLGVSGLILVVLIVVLPREEIWAALRRVSLMAWVAGVTTYLTLHLLGVLKWRLTVNLTGARLGFVQAAHCYYGGLFGNTFLPSILGGDVVRAGLAFGQTRSRTGLVVGSVLDRMLDLTALVAVAGLGALLLPDRLETLLHKVLLPSAGALLVGSVILAAVWILIPARRLPFKIRRHLVRLRRTARSVVCRPQWVLASLTLGFTLQGSLVLLNAWLGRTCGLECSLAVWFFVWPLAKLSAVLPVTQGGVGVREAALAALLVPFGVPAALAVAVGLVFEAVVITGGLIGGPVAMALGRLPRV
jgi:uncharacterized membrane protein YbhN (UPF0104 family)